ncbi:MAG TPA: hypothetical protein VMI54_22720 [Polyangiaceae bacterium]|nr:hypothetical protein [Polyangiaceae bacterium]
MRFTLRRALEWSSPAFVAVACSSDTGSVPGSGAPRAEAGSGAVAGRAGAAGSSAGGRGSVAGSGAAAGSPSGAGLAAGGEGTSGGSGGHGGAGASSAGSNAAGSGDTGGHAASASGGSAGAVTGGAAGAGEAGAAGSGESGGDAIPAGYVKAIIGVGYGGIRIVSRDGGNHWGDRVSAAANGGDDDDLLRAVVYGKGRWLASGWKLMSSDDGLHWTDHGKFNAGIIADEQIIEGLAYKDGYFYAAGDGDPSRIYRSSDGLAWSHFGEIGDTVKHTGLTFRAGVFVSYGDSNTSYRSSDGLEWTDMGIDAATYCENEWKSFEECAEAWWSDDGYYVLPQWGGDIQRSADGKSFNTVYSDDQSNTLYRSRAVAEGYVAPE